MRPNFLLVVSLHLREHFHLLKLESLPAMVAGVWSDDSNMQLEATTQFRKLLSIGIQCSVAVVLSIYTSIYISGDILFIMLFSPQSAALLLKKLFNPVSFLDLLNSSLDQIFLNFRFELDLHFMYSDYLIVLVWTSVR